MQTDTVNTNNASQGQALIKPGDVIGRYQVESLLGAGGMGVVYRAKHLDLEVHRAIKILRPGFSNEMYRRFQSEAKICARFDHPNLVRVYGVDSHNGLPFMEMEFVDGKPLDKIIEQHTRIPPDAALAISALACSGLSHTQGKEFTVRGVEVQGLVHRDIKPGNILISSTGDVKVTDFGLAQLGPLGLQTKVEAGWGTWIYYSPEQHQSRRPDMRSDIYAIGLVLYEMICGARAFPENTVEEMAEAKAAERFVSFKARQVNKLDFIEFIIAKCLRANPEKRYRSYESLGEAALSALAELTTRSAEAAVRKWITAPNSLRLVSPEPKNKNSLKTTLITLSAVLTVTLIAAIATAFFVFKNGKEPAAIQPAGTSVKTINPEAGAAIQQENAAALTKKPDSIIPVANNIKASQPGAEAISRPAAAVRTAEKPVPERRQAEDTDARPSTSTPLQKASQYFNNAGYAEVIKTLSTVKTESLGLSAKDSAFLMLLGSYYNSKRIKDAIELLKNHSPVDDGYYYLCKALVFGSLGRKESAVTAFDRAITCPSIIGSWVKRESYLQRALYYKTLFANEQSGDIQKQMVEAWRDFHTFACLKGGPGCLEAENIINNNNDRH